MRSPSFIIAILAASIILAFSQTGVCVGQEHARTYYENRLVRSDPNVPLVTRVDMKEMARLYLDDFSLVRKRTEWNYGREYVFQRGSDKATVFVTVGLHPSVREVEEIVLDYLSYISAVMREGPVIGEIIGDNVWWLSTSFAPHIVTNLVFIRKNALFILSSHSYEEVKELAKSIDNDILEEASYLTIKDAISPPVINMISVSKRDIKEGEFSKITINAIDPEGEPLEYEFFPGLGRTEGDPENMFTFGASRSNVPEPFFGSHTIKVVVINKSNVVSRIFETEVNISSTSIDDCEGNSMEAPQVFTLSQNVPNPFNPSTAIGFLLFRAADVRLAVYDALGRKVAVLAEGFFSAGNHEVRWNGRDTSGAPVSSGVYLYRLAVGGKAETRRMALVR